MVFMKVMGIFLLLKKKGSFELLKLELWTEHYTMSWLLDKFRDMNWTLYNVLALGQI
jgi:hypothetical protein